MAIILDGTTGITTPDLTDSSLTSGRVVYAGASGNLTGSSALTYNGTDLQFASGSGLFTNTSDGSDTGTLAIGGGGANSSARGGVIEFYGNENASAGVVDITSGNVANSYVRIQGRSSTSYVRFDINASEQMRLTSTGLKTKTTISVGDATPSTSGAGITFPATQSASSDANTLDDYEEGTWTPSCAGYNSSPTITYTTLTGTYTKIGRQVTVTFNIVVNTSSGGSGAILIGGLPFTASGRHVASLFSSGINFGTSATQLTGTTIDSAWIYLYGLVNDGASVDTNVGNVAAGDIIRGTLTYFI